MTVIPPPAPPDPAIVQQPEFKKGRRYTLEDDFARIISGEAEVPNFEPIPAWQALKATVGHYGHTVERHKRPDRNFDERTEARIPGAPLDKGHAIYYLNVGQGGGFTGEGLVVATYYNRSGEEGLRAGRFAICKHEKVEGAGANHQRGWHPGYCGKCGLDMSVDSGD